MLRDEAEREADRRNREDQRRKRLEFYAFDETAGGDDDGWTVAVRLRRTPQPDQATAVPGPAAAAAAVSESRPPGPEPAAPPEQEPAPAPELAESAAGEPDDPQPTQAYDVVAREFHQGAAIAPARPEPPTEVAPKVPEPVPPPEPAMEAEPEEDEEGDLEDDQGYPEYEDAYYSEAFPDSPYGEEDLDKPGLFVRTIGAIVLIVGWLWLLMLIALAVVIRPDVPSAIALYVVGFVAGLCVLWLGVAIRRS